MTIGNLERVLGAMGRDVLTSNDACPQDGVIRTQAAVVHSVVDQIRHRHPSDACVAFLRDQAKEELLRLMREMRMRAPLWSGAGALVLRELG